MSEEREHEVIEHLAALGYIDPGAGSSVWQSILARFLNMTSGIRKLFGGQPAREDEE